MQILAPDSYRCFITCELKSHFFMYKDDNALMFLFFVCFVMYCFVFFALWPHMTVLRALLLALVLQISPVELRRPHKVAGG